MEYVTLKLELAYHELENMVWGKAQDNLSILEYDEEIECALQAIQARFEGHSTFYDINDYISGKGFLEDILTKIIIRMGIAQDIKDLEKANKYYEMALSLKERIR